jgi:hypothetical protein
MSTIKNFGLAGIGTDVQFGKGGPRLIQTGGVFSVKNATAASLVALEVAAPTADAHAATRLFVNNGLSATRTGAGLNTTTGVYTANGTANYLAAATSIHDATQRLDTALKNVSIELDTTQTGAGLGATGTYTAPGTSNYLSSASSLKDADTKLDTAIYNVQTELDTVEAAAGFTAAGALPAWSGTNYITNTTTLVGAVTTLDTTLKSANDAIAAIGNAFNYVGTLAGGANTGTAYDLSTLPAAGKNAGDYYKVSSAGYFKDTSAGGTYYANVGDGLVKNTTADGWDKIDNTDSTVAGTANRIAVTGSPDTGYTVDVDSAYVGQTSITTLGSIATGTWNATTIGVNRGGTGLTTYAVGDILYASGTSTLAKLAKGTAKQILRMNTGATAPEYANLIATDVAFSDAGFTATNVSAALIELDAQITSMTSDAIQSTDTKTAISVNDTTGIMFYDEVSAAKTEILRLTGSTTSATLTAQGSGANINIVLDPKGTGIVDVSAARVANVANATAATDALPFGQSKAIHTSYAVADITEANANVSIGPVNGVVLRVIVYLSAAFSGGSTLTVGYSGSQSALVAATEIEHTAAGIYVINNVTVINQTILAYITGTGSGAGKVIVEYLAT